MNTRIKEIRKKDGSSQEKFGKVIGVSRDTIANIEAGRIEIKDIFITSICREFSINEEWLRTGKGEMYKPIEDKLSYYVSEITDGDDDFIKDLILAYMDLDEDSKKALRLLAENMLNIKKNKE